ncbi:hypothetical protein [Candidatus Uabimicrobium amorphum]|nr:hypothetical protein [Candidatus Uabimicrobium amorphum]
MIPVPGMEKLLELANEIKITPLWDSQEKINIELDLPEIKTIDISACKSYSEIPIDWFDRFPTLEKVILPFGLNLVATLREFPPEERIKFKAFYEKSKGYALCRNTQKEDTCE